MDEFRVCGYKRVCFLGQETEVEATNDLDYTGELPLWIVDSRQFNGKIHRVW